MSLQTRNRLTGEECFTVSQSERALDRSPTNTSHIIIVSNALDAIFQFIVQKRHGHFRRGKFLFQETIGRIPKLLENITYIHITASHSGS